MDELTGPVLGITFVLMAVFLPAAFMPGITGQLYRQFALVIAATAVISAVNAAHPQAGAVLPVPASRRPAGSMRSTAGSTAFTTASKTATPASSDAWFTAAAVMMAVYVGLVVVTFWGFVAIPTGFIPEEDQGYAIVGIQLPDAAAIERTGEVAARVERILKEVPGVAHLLTIGGISLLDNSASLPNGAVVYVIYEDFETRGKAGHTQAKILGEAAPPACGRTGGDRVRGRAAGRSRGWASRAASR